VDISLRVTQTLTLETRKLNNCLAGKVSRLRFEYVGHRDMQYCSRLERDSKGGTMLDLLHTVPSRKHTWHIKLPTSTHLCPTWFSVPDPEYLP
jgi:hypothetical protein